MTEKEKFAFEKTLAENLYHAQKAELERQKRKVRSTEKTLEKAVDWIVNCDLDVCKVCGYYNKESFETWAKIDGDVDPCIYRRAGGKDACRDGIIEHFRGCSHE